MVTVKDLKNGEIDFFKGVEVKFSGFDGNGFADVSYSQHIHLSTMIMTTESDVENGDSYTVTANIDVYGAEESGNITIGLNMTTSIIHTRQPTSRQGNKGFHC